MTDQLDIDFDNFCKKLALQTGEHEASIRRLGRVFYQGGYRDGLIKSKGFLDDIADQAEQALAMPLESPQYDIGSLLRRPDFTGLSIRSDDKGDDLAQDAADAGADSAHGDTP